VNFSTYHDAADQTFQLINPFVLLFRCVYCLVKYLKSMSNVYWLKTSGTECFFALKVGHRNLCTERNFL